MAFIAMAVSYLIGAIPWSAIVAYLFAGTDLRSAGTRNVGAANAWISAGPVAGCLAAIGDSAKGALAIILAQALGLSQPWWPLCAWCAIVGHSWSCFLGFRGGIGAAATAGAFLYLLPLESAAVGLLVATWWLTFGGAFLLGLASLWPIAIVVALSRGSLTPGAAFGVMWLAGWVFVRGLGHLKYDIKTFEAALGSGEVRRKLYRYSGLFFPCLVYPIFGMAALRWIFFLGAAAAWVLEISRRRWVHLNDLLCALFRPVGRKGEVHGISSTSYYFLGGAIAVAFPEPFGPVALVMATLADAWAALCGRRWGRHVWFKGKTIEGSASCLLAAFASGLVYSALLPFFLPWYVILGSAIMVALGEALFVGEIDNLFLAPAAAFTLWYYGKWLVYGI